MTKQYYRHADAVTTFLKLSLMPPLKLYQFG